MAVNALPSLLFGMAAGVFVDRLDKRKIMIAADLLRGISTALIAFLFITGSLKVYYLYIFTFFNSFCEIFAYPARASAMQVLVNKEHYLSANSLKEASTSAAQIVGTGFAAYVLGFWSIGAAVLIDAVTFFISAFTAAAAKIENTTSAGNSALNIKAFLEELKEGFMIVKGNTVLFISVILAFVANLALAPFNILVPVYSDKILLAGAKGYSFIEMSFTIGIILGSVALGQIGHKFKKSILILAGFAALGTGVALLGFVYGLYIAVTVCTITGAFIPLINTCTNTLIQETTPKDMMGRVSSTLGTLCMLGLPLGYAASGFIAEGLNVQATFMVLGALITFTIVPVLFVKEFFRH
ncbi:MAG: MFS transporter [Caulobacteraceae bacterium]